MSNDTFEKRTELDQTQNKLTETLRDYLHLLPLKYRSEILELAAEIIQARDRRQKVVIQAFLNYGGSLQDLDADFGFDPSQLELGNDFQKKLQVEINKALDSDQFKTAKKLIEVWTRFCGRKVEDLNLELFKEFSTHQKSGVLASLKKDGLQTEILDQIELWTESLGFDIAELGLENWTKADFENQVKKIQETQNGLNRIKTGIKIWTEVLGRDLQDLDTTVFGEKIKFLIRRNIFNSSQPNLLECRQIAEFWVEKLEPTMGTLELELHVQNTIKRFMEDTAEVSPAEDTWIWIWVNLCKRNVAEIDGVENSLKSFIEAGGQNYFEHSLMIAIKIWKELLGRYLGGLNLEKLHTYLNEHPEAIELLSIEEAEIWLDCVYDPNREGDKYKRSLIIQKLEREFIAGLRNSGRNDSKKSLGLWHKFEPEKAAIVSAFLQLDPEQQKHIFDSAQQESQSKGSQCLYQLHEYICALTEQAISARK